MQVASFIEQTALEDSSPFWFIETFVTSARKYSKLFRSLAEAAERSKKKLRAKDLSDILELCGPKETGFWESTVSEDFPNCLKKLKSKIASHSNVDFTSNK